MRHWKLWIRDSVTAVLVALPLLGLGLWVTVSSAPQSALVQSARQWPLIGHWVAVVANSKTEDTIASASESTRESEVTVEIEGLYAWFDVGTELHKTPDGGVEQILEVPTRLAVVERRGVWIQLAGKAQGWLPMAADDPTLLEKDLSQRRRVSVGTGETLFVEPGGALVARTETAVNLAVDRVGSGDWVRVVFDDRKLWLRAPQFTGGEPPLGSAPEPVRPLPAEKLSASSLDLARTLWTGPEVSANASPYQVLGDTPRVRSVAAVCAGPLRQLDADFEALTGVAARWQARETLLVFATRDAYHEFLASGPLPTSDPAGIARPSQGFAATHVEGLSEARVCEVLVHEAVHLTSRRAFGPQLPPWLAEGIAALLEKQVGPGLTQVEDSRKAGAAKISLLRMDERFYQGDLAVRYEVAAAWVELLLTDPRYGQASREFLRDRAAGLPLDPEAEPEVAYLATSDRFWEAWQRKLGASDEEVLSALASRGL